MAKPRRPIVASMEPPLSQTSSHFPLEPISASVLAENEKRRRDALKKLGAMKTGCKELDGHVLLGGFEMGCVVGLSAEEEDRVGVLVRNRISTFRHVGNEMDRDMC